MKSTIEQLEDVLESLNLEKEEDISQYNRSILQISLQERTKNGTSWYPLQLKEIGYGLGDQPFVIFERSKNQTGSHQFSSGKMVNLFTNQPGFEHPHCKGIVNFVNRTELKIFLYENDHPDWINDGKLGIDLLFDDRSYREMDKAMQLVLGAERNRLADFREIFKGHKKPEFSNSNKPYFSAMLNDSQNRAISQIIAAEDICIVHGPPGTGKTTTIVEAMRMMAMEGKKIMATAASNTAVDWLASKLTEVGLNVVRIGNISRVDEEIINLTLEARLYNSPEAKEIKKMKRQAEDMRAMAKKYKRNFGYEERQQRKLLFKEAKDIANQVQIIESYLVDKILTEADVVCATLVGSMGRYVSEKQFDVVVIDEAAQAMEPATWIAISKAKEKVILAGDPFQLPPTVKSNKAAKAGLEKTLIEQSIEVLDQVNLLNVQYRMNELIMGYSNQHFYNNQLQADESVRFQTLSVHGEKSPALEFIDTAGCGFEEIQNPKTKSLYNPDEYKILWKHLDLLIDGTEKTNIPTIGIISPYKQQVLFIKNEIDSYFTEKLASVPIVVNTIDSFQGQEKDVIYISLVRNNEKGTIGFLSDYRRMNVAMTRARKKLVIIGDSATLGNHKFYKDFIDYCEQNEAYKSAWEYLY